MDDTAFRWNHALLDLVVIMKDDHGMYDIPNDKFCSRILCIDA
jgi:hypothetical protein